MIIRGMDSGLTDRYFAISHNAERVIYWEPQPEPRTQKPG